MYLDRNEMEVDEDPSLRTLKLKSNSTQVSLKNIIVPLLTNCPIVLSSRLFENVLSLSDVLTLRTELKILLLSDLDSSQGIPVEANQPLGCARPVINLTRPAVLRIYFGLSSECTMSLNVLRPTYGPISTSSSVGMDPYNFSTKAMSLHLYNIGIKIRNYLLNSTDGNFNPYLKENFNHCTVLLYSGDNNNGQSNSSLSYHSDCTYDHEGNFSRGRNSQKQNSCVAVLTLGDKRTLNFKKRVAVAGSNGRLKWQLTDDKLVSFDLCENSLFVLHPSDEIPLRRKGDEYKSQYVHGGIKIINPNVFSIAFAFRVVGCYREYNPVTSKLIPKVEDVRNCDSFYAEKNNCLRQELEHFKSKQLQSYSNLFTSFVHSKFKEWKW